MERPNKLKEFSRPGTYVADFMFTLLAIERGAIKNSMYVDLADKLKFKAFYVFLVPQHRQRHDVIPGVLVLVRL